MAKIKRCYLHIGTEKTGTSSLQSYLSKNREMLTKLGIFYPDSSGQGDSHNLFSAAISDKFDFETKRGKARALNLMTRQLKRNHTSHTVVISAEHFHSRVTKIESLTYLYSYLREYFDEILVVAYLRPQIQLLESRLTTSLKGGGNIPIPINIDKIINGTPDYYDYRKMIDKWGSVFGRENIILRIFEKDSMHNGDLFEDFCSIINADPAALNKIQSVNEGLSVDAQVILQELNKHIPRLSERSNPEHWKRLEIRKLFSKFSGKGYKVSYAEAVKFMEFFEEGNRALQERYFPDRKELFAFKPEVDRPKSIDDQISYEKLKDITSQLILETMKQ